MISWITDKIEEIMIISFILCPIWVSTIIVLNGIKYLSDEFILIMGIYFLLCSLVTLGASHE